MELDDTCLGDTPNEDDRQFDQAEVERFDGDIGLKDTVSIRGVSKVIGFVLSSSIPYNNEDARDGDIVHSDQSMGAPS